MDVGRALLERRLALPTWGGKCGACGWSVGQLDFDEELRSVHGMFGSDGCRTRGPSHHQEGETDGLFVS